jgi:hypothetical protein
LLRDLADGNDMHTRAATDLAPLLKHVRGAVRRENITRMCLASPDAETQSQWRLALGNRPFIRPILWRQRRSYLHSGFAEYVDELLVRETDVTVDIYRDPDAGPGSGSDDE